MFDGKSGARRNRKRRSVKVCAIGLRGIPNVMGGIEAHCENLYPRLTEMDSSLDITVIGRSRYARSGEYKNVRLVSLWAPRRAKLETVIHTPLAILYARLFLHPDIIHLHAVGPGFFTPLARLLGFRVVGTHHSADFKRDKFGRFGRWFLRTGEAMMGRFANKVICVSSILEADLAKRHPRRQDHFVTIRNGAPPQQAVVESGDALFESLGIEKKQYILCVGRLDPAKGFPDIVAAYKIAKPRGLKLVIVGGSMGSDSFAADLAASAPEDVVFAGARPADQVRILYKNAALFVHPSHHEGFAIVVLEALAADVPILISDIPPHLEVELEAQCYFPTGDVAALAKILSLGKFEHLRSQKRVAILRENDWETVARRHLDIFRSEVSQGPLALAVTTS